MKCGVYVVLALYFNAAIATFWKNDDFERIVGSLSNSMSQDYLRALSIFKRKLQLLGFYPIVLNDDGLEYVSMEPYLLEDDYDDRMYKLLKEMKKEKKSRKKAQKKKSKKTKKTTTEEPTPTTTMTTLTIASTTAVQPISNIVYYWPATITNVVHPSQSEGTSTYQHSIDTEININESSEENSYEAVDSNSSGEIVMNSSDKKIPPTKINYATKFSFQRKFDSDDGDTRAVESQISTTTTTTTPYPLITVFPDPEDVAIQEILDQQEIVNKIADLEDVHENLIEADQRVKVPGYMELPTLSTDVTKDDEEHHTVEGSVPIESTKNPDTTAASVTITESSVATESPLLIPPGALQFFHETLPDEPLPAISSSSEIIIPFPTSTDAHISDQITETTENNRNTNGNRETDSQPNYAAVQLNVETTTTPQSIADEQSISTTPKPSDDKPYAQLEITPPNAVNQNEIDAAEGYQYLIDPKITLESRSLLTDEPVLVAVIVDDKNGRRSDVPIEADDLNEDDTTDNLAYNLTGENSLEKSSSVVENTSAEITTKPPVDPPTPSPPLNLDDQFGGEIIPLIPIIIKQMKQGNVSPEEMEIMRNTFGPFWPYIVEEASREGDSSEEMNPLLGEVLNSVNRKIVKREATPTYGRWRRPIYRRRRVYFDDDDFVPSRRYYGRRGRPIIEYY